MVEVMARTVLRPAVDWFRPTRELETELQQIEARILHQASQFDPGAEGYVRYALEGGGKRLRPALVLLAGKVAGGWTESIRDLAVIVELVHVASLIHDDVLDRADLRRSGPPAMPSGARNCRCCWEMRSLPTGCNWPRNWRTRKLPEKSPRHPGTFAKGKFCRPSGGST